MAKTINLYDPIGERYGGDTPATVSEQLGDYSGDLVVNINSYGGSVFEGVAISSILRSHPGDVRVVVQGIAGSIASIIALAGDSIGIHDGAFMMVHRPAAMVDGDADELRNAAAQLDSIQGEVTRRYQARTGAEAATVAAWLSGPTGTGSWFTASESVELGLADEVLDELAIAAHVDPQSAATLPPGVKIDPEYAPKRPKWAQNTPRPAGLVACLELLEARRAQTRDQAAAGRLVRLQIVRERRQAAETG